MKNKYTILALFMVFSVSLIAQNNILNINISLDRKKFVIIQSSDLSEDFNFNQLALSKAYTLNKKVSEDKKNKNYYLYSNDGFDDEQIKSILNTTNYKLFEYRGNVLDINQLIETFNKDVSNFKPTEFITLPKKITHE